MSPALLKKYLAAARDIANHAYLNADGLHFAPHTMLADVDADKLFVHRIVDFYHQHNTNYADYFAAAWRYKHRAALGRPRATLADIAADAKVSAKYLATLWDVFEGPRATVGPDRQRPGAVAGAAAARPEGRGHRRRRTRGAARLHRGAAREDRAALPQPGRARRQRRAAAVHDLAQRAVRHASHGVRSGAAAGRGRAARRRRSSVRSRATTSSGRGRRRSIVNATGDPDLVVPAGQRARYEAQFARFSRVFPDMFYMQERGRHYFDRTTDRGRYLDAGFHSLMGYFRDDQPLYELILDAAQQRQLDALWLDMDVVGNVTSRMYQQYIENQTSQGGGRGRVVMPPNPTSDLVTSQPRIKAIEARLPRRGRRRRAADVRGDPPVLRVHRRSAAHGGARCAARPSRSTSTR